MTPSDAPRIGLILLIFLLILNAGYGQELEHRISRLSIINPEYQSEFKVSTNSTIFIGAGLSPTYSQYEVNGNKSSSLGVNLYFKGHIRRYFNRAARHEKNKTVDGNSGFYGSFGMDLYVLGSTEEASAGYARAFNILYGFQNKIGKKGFYNLSAGLAYAGFFYTETNTGGLIPVVNINLGFILKVKEPS